MEFKIHGHACLEVLASGKSIICDPWLVGSAYWRSWWNYPPLQPNILDQINPDYIYITHIHWDHFHGPTLRKLGTEKTIIIPKTPELRLLKDIKSIGFKNIIELEHGQTIELSQDFRLTSYQFGPVFADSVVILEAGDRVLFNSNDAKIMGLPLKQILQRHPSIDFVFRSHSSANSRVCYELVDEGGGHIDDMNKYSQEFALFAKAVGAKYAIPFASNQCCLHPETIDYNQYNNYAHKVAAYFQKQQIKHPECVVMAPGDSWNSATGFCLQDNTKWYTDAVSNITQYQQEKTSTLDKVTHRENNSKLKISLAKRYAEWLIAETPWFIRRFFKDRPITLIGSSHVETTGLKIDLYNKSYEFIKEWNMENNPIQVYVNNAVLNDVWAKRHWNSLGVSKRLKIKIRRKDTKYYEVFNLLNNSLEAGSLQSRYIFTPRYIKTYLKRWREILLYLNIIANKLRGQSFDYQKYLPSS
ncbi:MAG: MBL fold metallo-hydrolase [Pleurocapsa sp.]